MVIAQNTKQILSIPSAYTDPRNNFRQIIFKELGWVGLQEMDSIHFSTGKMLQHSGNLLTLGFHLHWVCGFWFTFTKQLRQLPPTPPATVPLSAGATCPVSRKEYPHLAAIPVHHPDFHSKLTLNRSFKLRHWVLRFILVRSSDSGIDLQAVREGSPQLLFLWKKVSFPDKYIDVF